MTRSFRFERVALVVQKGSLAEAIGNIMKNQNEELKTYSIPPDQKKGGGPGSGGQSGDTQGLPDVAVGGFESIAELVEEGQYAEAEALLAVEDAAGDDDVAELRTKELLQDDVPLEYLDKD